MDTHYSHGLEGTGLGLAISKALCQMMDGEISVESEYGKGSVFTVSILQKKGGSAEPLLPSSGWEGCRILILEKVAPYAGIFFKVHGSDAGCLYPMQ